VFLALLSLAAMASPHTHVKGVTISCQTWGIEWADPQFEKELIELKGLGVNWVAIHPYGRIGKDGSVSWKPWPKGQAPDWLRLPAQWAEKHGISLLIKPHLAYWGSPFSWRGEIEFDDPNQLDRFFETYGRWVESIAQAVPNAHGFAVATELDKLIKHENRWRSIIERIRKQTLAKLTYAANWNSYHDVRFWDALDAIGIQAYFPIEGSPADPSAARDAWEKHLKTLRLFSKTIGKPVIFTELGYDATSTAARKPWRGLSYREPSDMAGSELQQQLYDAALSVQKENSSWLRGMFLWKWFVGEAPDENFILDKPPLHALLKRHWNPVRLTAAPIPEPKPLDMCEEFNRQEANKLSDSEHLARYGCPPCPCSCMNGQITCAPCVACDESAFLPKKGPVPSPPPKN
jgi:hypothetical protein